ncbi:DEAD/DEAH box helicase [Haloarcula amylolytica]|uniref:DEAD/DEAH box helicase n=1 Tax=Haloarcula amylolytica JCM 13557 TaxID=1227452 RepID=M0KC94_9EURY|nr:DEAD/DEAH box helicase family protein [Haloarcula amylolytica]EMA18438.1 DEAD/DEAH box helicase [Haloarcula amylolytica JCM 13557]
MTAALTGITPRPYQDEAHEFATRRDEAVVCLPTGTGKTLVGCMWARTRLHESAIDRILILEPSRFLVEQTHAYYDEYTTIPTTKLDGTVPPSTRSRQWHNGDIVVTTPQTAVNDAANLDFDAVIIDECHHTTGQHAFAQLLDHVEYRYKLGLSATIPASKERDITTAIGPIHRRSWTDLPDEHVPEWIGEIYDTPYPDAYTDVVDILEDARREFAGTRLAGLPTLGIRMLCRDGALALEETLRRNTVMSDILRDDTLPVLDTCPAVHKLDACRAALDEHDFEKAVLFVDRVTIAKQLDAELSEYTTTTLLGRVHTSSDAQQAAVETAQAEETDLIISTAAGEEGIDLPAADLLIVWSNVVSSVRFIQRLGRIMRPDGTDAPRNAIYLATPDSPDYEALRRGIDEAHRAGLDITNINTDTLLTRSSVGRVKHALEGTPQQRSDLANTLNQPASKLDNWLRTNVRDSNVFYLYRVPEDLNEWRQASNGLKNAFGFGSDDDSGETQLADSVRNNFSPTKDHRYYLQEPDIHILETDHPDLLTGNETTRLSASYGPSHQDSGKHSEYGNVDTVTNTMTDNLADADSFYATISTDSRNPQFSFQMQYQGTATKPVINATVRNAAAVATTLTDRLTE